MLFPYILGSILMVIVNTVFSFVLQFFPRFEDNPFSFIRNFEIAHLFLALFDKLWHSYAMV